MPWVVAQRSSTDCKVGCLWMFNRKHWKKCLYEWLNEAYSVKCYIKIIYHSTSLQLEKNRWLHFIFLLLRLIARPTCNLTNNHSETFWKVHKQLLPHLWMQTGRQNVAISQSQCVGMRAPLWISRLNELPTVVFWLHCNMKVRLLNTYIISQLNVHLTLTFV